MAQINFEELLQVREKFKGKKIVFCSGGFDLTHAGHILFLEDCKKFGDILVVGLGSDAARKEEKGDERPIFNEHIRLKIIESLKPVDYVFIVPLPIKHPFSGLDRIMEKLRPDVYVINSDAFDIPYRQEMVKRFNSQLIILERWCPPEFENISTTKIIEKIKRINKGQNKKF